MNNLRIIREIYGITQNEIAKAININRTTISTWENQAEKKSPVLYNKADGCILYCPEAHQE